MSQSKRGGTRGQRITSSEALDHILGTHKTPGRDGRNGARECKGAELGEQSGVDSGRIAAGESRGQEE